MANKVSEMPGDGRNNAAYKFDKWLDGSIWELKEGTDYKNYHSMRQSAYQAAARLGLLVSVKIRGKKAYIQSRKAK